MDASCLFISFCCFSYSRANASFLSVLGSCHALQKNYCWLVPCLLLKRSPKQQSFAPATNTFSNKWDTAKKLLTWVKIAKLVLPFWKHFCAWTGKSKNASWKKKRLGKRKTWMSDLQVLESTSRTEFAGKPIASINVMPQLSGGELIPFSYFDTWYMGATRWLMVTLYQSHLVISTVCENYTSVLKIPKAKERLTSECAQ